MTRYGTLAALGADLADPAGHAGLSPVLGDGLAVVELTEFAGAPADDHGNVVPAALRLPRPWLAVGVHRDGALPASPHLAAGFDVLLTTVADPPRPWVHVPDADADTALAAIAERVRTMPAACVTLGQILRAGETMPLADALLYESLAFSMLLAGPDFARWLAARPAPRAKPEPEEVVLCERVGDRLEIVLHRPHAHNAFSATLRDSLVRALELAVFDDSLTGVRLSGSGPSFCSGGDLHEFGSAPNVATAHLVRTTRSPVLLLDRLQRRLGAGLEFHVHGACIGAGAEMSAAGGRVVARPGTYFALPEVAMGLVPGAGGTATLPRRIGRHRTCYLALTGERLPATQAHAWGLVDEVVDAPVTEPDDG